MELVYIIVQDFPNGAKSIWEMMYFKSYERAKAVKDALPDPSGYRVANLELAEEKKGK